MMLHVTLPHEPFNAAVTTVIREIRRLGLQLLKDSFHLGSHATVLDRSVEGLMG
jgi:hypothetical protein